MIEILEFLRYFGYNVFVMTLTWVLISSWQVVSRLPKIQLYMLVGGAWVSGISYILLWFFK